MHDYQLASCVFQLVRSQNIDTGLPVVFLRRCKPLALDTRHIQHVQPAYAFLDGIDLIKFGAGRAKLVRTIIRQAQRLGGNEEKAVIFILDKRRQQRMHRPPV
jgi:hypothetical protein